MKTLISVALILISCVSYAANTISRVIPASSAVNFVSGSLNASQFILSSSTTNVGYVTLFDAPTGVLTNITPANITSGVYATNYITSYTNFFGIQNNFTNISLVTYSITNAATTNYYPSILSVNAGTNATTVVPDVNYFFSRGLTVTNVGAGSVTFSVTYQQ